MISQTADVSVRSMRPEEAPAVSQMIGEAFRESIAPGVSAEGQQEFFEYAAPEQLVGRAGRGHRFLLATSGEQIAGLIEVHPPAHIAQLLVPGAWQGKGVASLLLDTAFPRDVTARGITVTVNAAPELVTTYGRLGFRVMAAEQMHQGVRFVPMSRSYGPVFFAVALAKMAAMCVCSLGLYHIAWNYWNWRHERDRTGEPISPFWRTFFAPFWIHSLFHRVRREAGQVGIAPAWSVGVFTVATVMLWATVFLPQPLSLVSLLAFVPSLPVQGTINAVNRKVAPDSPSNDRFSPVNIVMLIIGCLLLSIVILGMLAGVPEPPPETISV